MPLPMATDRTLPPPPMVALAAWLVPGAGYWLIGQKVRAATIGVTIVTVFVLGILIAGVRVVEAPDMSGAGSVTARILQRPWFLGQVLTGPIGLASAYAAGAAERSPRFHNVESKARIAEIGRWEEDTC